MSEPVLVFGQWVQEHLGEFAAARERFDRRHAADQKPGAAPPAE
jgi:hypothetical protein